MIYYLEIVYRFCSPLVSQNLSVSENWPRRMLDWLWCRIPQIHRTGFLLKHERECALQGCSDKVFPQIYQIGLLLKNKRQLGQTSFEKYLWRSYFWILLLACNNLFFVWKILMKILFLMISCCSRAIIYFCLKNTYDILFLMISCRLHAIIYFINKVCSSFEIKNFKKWKNMANFLSLFIISKFWTLTNLQLMNKLSNLFTIPAPKMNTQPHWKCSQIVHRHKTYILKLSDTLESFIGLKIRTIQKNFKNKTKHGDERNKRF